MDIFQILRCLWKCLDKTLQSIVLEFSKTNPPKVGILIKNTISKFSKTKNQTEKMPHKV